MLNLERASTDLRLLLPEVIELEPDHFQQATEMSNQVRSEAQQWQTYLNTLALSAFQVWLRDRIPEQAINRESNLIESICQLKVGEFKLGLIATEHILDEVVNVPQEASCVTMNWLIIAVKSIYNFPRIIAINYRCLYLMSSLITSCSIAVT